MCEELRGHDIGEAQEVESLRCTSKECGHQPIGDEESWSLIRGRMSKISTDSNVTPEDAAWSLLPCIQGFTLFLHPQRNMNKITTVSTLRTFLNVHYISNDLHIENLI